MRSLIVSTFMTLDGVMQAPGGPEEDPSGGFQHGGWSVTHWDEMMAETMERSMGTSFDLLLGRRTYEIFAAHWPHSTEEGAEQLNAARKYVASRTLDRAAWQNSTLLQGEVPEAVARLREEDGPEIQVHGSANLVQTLLAHDLVDEHRIWIFPVVVGGGKRLFEAGAPARGFELVDSAVSSTGVIITTYRRAGELEVGSFALDEPSAAEVERRATLEA